MAELTAGRICAKAKVEQWLGRILDGGPAARESTTKTSASRSGGVARPGHSLLALAPSNARLTLADPDLRAPTEWAAPGASEIVFTSGIGEK